MSLTLSRILHAGYLFECEGCRIIFDPIFENPFSRNCHAFPSVRFDLAQIRQQRFDAVFISHFHDDHCSLESLDLIDRDTPIYLYCLFDEFFEMIRALGFKQVHPLQIDVAVTMGGFQVIPRHALDAGVDSMFHVKVAGLNVLNVVDASIDPATLKQLGRYAPWDLVLWPFQTMRETEVIWPSRATAATADLPEEWKTQLQVLQPRYVVPSSCQFQAESWSWYNRAFFPMTYAGFARQVQALLPAVQVVRLNPGVTICLTRFLLEYGTPLPWVLPVGEQNVDYVYDPSLSPPSLAEVARCFPGLNDAQMQQVVAYCNEGLPAKYRALESGDSAYFETARHWYLTVYDHQGHGIDFHYTVDGQHLCLDKVCLDKVCLDKALQSPVGWRTEIIAYKLFAALMSGETLTTLYLRINDYAFDAPTWESLQETEIADDPLVRCLFDEALGAYQREQLQRLGIS